MKVPPPPAAVPPALLADLEEPDKDKIVALAASVQVPRRSVVCRQGEVARSMFVVRSGGVRFARSTAEGRDVLLRLLGPGDCFGLASLVPGAVDYMATGVTMNETGLYVWEAATIRSAAAACPQLARNALRIALHYVREFGDRHAALLSRTAVQRLARTLAEFGATKGRVTPAGVEIEVTNHDLAALSDVSTFTVSRQLQQWERAGHLLKNRGRILLRHPEALLPD